MKPITGDTCERAWLLAAEYLSDLSGHTEHNLVLEITHPMLHQASDKKVRNAVDQFLRRHKANPVSTVAGTIFPASEYVNFGARGVYEIYPDEVYPEIREGAEWGRY